MRKVIIVLIFLAPYASLAQVGLRTNTLTNTNLRIFYQGLVNEIEVTGLTNYNNLNVKSSNGTKFFLSKKKFFSAIIIGFGIDDSIRPNYYYFKCDSLDTIRVFQNNKLLLEKIFEVRRLPDAVVSFGNISDTVATVAEIISNPVFNVYLPNCYYKYLCHMNSFQTTLKAQDGYVIKEFNQTPGGNLTGEQIRLFQFLLPGDKIYFTNIKISSPPNGCSRAMEPITITIK